MAHVQVEHVLEAMGYSISYLPPDTMLPRFATFIAPIVASMGAFLSETASLPVRLGTPFPGEEGLTMWVLDTLAVAVDNEWWGMCVHTRCGAHHAKLHFVALGFAGTSCTLQHWSKPLACPEGPFTPSSTPSAT
jgi:hypothetical protein